MTKSKLFLIFGAAVLGITLVYSVYAQNTAPGAAPMAPRAVALVDIVHILSENATIEREFARLSEQYGKALQTLGAEYTEKAKALEERRKTYQPGSPNYLEVEQQMLALTSSMNTRRMVIHRDATEARIRVLRNAYEVTQRHTSVVANFFGMTVVLNYDRSPLPDNIPLMDPERLETLIMQFQQYIATRTVVWANTKTVDITELVLKEIQKADPTTVVAKKPAPAPVNQQIGPQAQIPQGR